MEDLKFYKIKSEIESFLKKYDFKEHIAGEKKAILYVLDSQAISFLKEMNNELRIEYSHNATFYKKHNLSSIIKVINWNNPCHSFRIFNAYNWREINDQEKVFDILKKELEKTFNIQKVNVDKKLKAKEVSLENRNEIIEKIKSEYLEAKKEVEFMIANKDKITARISEYYRRRIYPRVDFIINKKRQTAVGLKTTSLNGIWYEDLEDELAKNANNQLIDFLKKAKNPFGDVYYIINEDV